jgi:hypothetical protein
MIRRSILLAAVCLSIASAAAAKPSITWVSGPVFSKSGPPPGRTTFIVQGPVDVSDLQDDFAKAFGGDSTAGQAYFVTALKECLSGVRVLGEPPHGIQRDERHRLAWRAFPTAVPSDTVTWSTTWVDSAKTSPTLHGADSLSAALARTDADWLIAIDGLVATLEPGQPGMTHFTPYDEMRTEGGQLPVATLTALVGVLGAHPGAIVGYGRVSAWFQTGRFRKTSVDDMARWFALELERALKKR